MPSPTRRQFLAATGLAVGIAGCLSEPTPRGTLDAVDGHWAMTGQNAGHTRSIDGRVAEPETAWTRELSGAQTAGTPSLDGKRLYVPASAVADRPPRHYWLYALSATTGEERWQIPLRADPNASPAVSADWVVVTARRSTEAGRVVSFHAESGEEAWAYDVDARVTASPTVDGLTAYVPDWNGEIHALSVTDGSLEWSRTVESGNRAFATPAAVREGRLYVASSTGTVGLVSLDADTGEERWSRSTAVVTSGPVVAGNFVAVRSHTGVEAFDADGQHLFTFNVPEDHGAELAVDDQFVYAPDRNRLYAIDRTGERAWTYEGETPLGPPTVVGDSVLVADDGDLVALSRTDGVQQWREETDGSGAVVATADALFLAGSGARLTALQ